MAIQTALDSISNSSGSPFGFKNRIINGAMQIDQRNAGASVSKPLAAYVLDRWLCNVQSPTTATVSGSTTAPAGFTNSLFVNVTTGGSIGSTANYIQQSIEGFNTADLGFGSATASTITISFWVRSSVIGTFGGALRNYNVSPATSFRAYPFTYSISAANTWEQKSVTIAGDGTGGAGQWNTGNQGSFSVFFDLGSGTATGTAGSWAGSNFIGATGTQTGLMTTNGATFYITGVQLERGSNATSFEFRDYGRELILCQRYLFRINGASEYVGLAGFGSTGGGTGVSHPILFPVQLRATPTLSVSAASDFRPINDTSFSAYSALLYYGNNVGGRLSGTTSGVSNGSGVGLYAVNSTGWINFSAEL